MESQAMYALLLSVGAGLSTLIGWLVVLVAKRKDTALLSAALGFAAGVMMSVSFMDLMPEAVQGLGHTLSSGAATALSVAFLLLGVCISALMDRLVPHDSYDAEAGEAPHQDLFRVGLVSTAAIALHNFPEGIATFMAGLENTALGISVALAIAFHNIPEGIVVAMPVYYASGSRKRALLYTLLSGLAEPMGAILAFLILRPFISQFLLGAIFAAVSGIMLYIALEELIPSSRQYGHDRLALWCTLAGICLMPLTHILG